MLTSGGALSAKYMFGVLLCKTKNKYKIKSHKKPYKNIGKTDKKATGSHKNIATYYTIIIWPNFGRRKLQGGSPETKMALFCVLLLFSLYY